ncbi:MAG: hypothetical protein V4648_00280 [Bacteroidota bacterium]
MNVKNFIVGGIVGGIVDFLLGWLFYGILFKDCFPESPDMKLEYIFLGCMTFGFFVSFIFTRWAGISDLMGGLKAGAIIGLFSSLYMNFFMYSNMPINYQTFAIDVCISIVLSAGVGAAVGMINGKMK